MRHFDSIFPKTNIQKVTIYGSVITLVGTSGTADITINNIVNAVSLSFSSSLTATANVWVAANLAYYKQRGYAVSASAGVITVTPESDWDTVNRINASIANLTEDLSGTLTGVFEPDFFRAKIWDVTFTMNSLVSNPRNVTDGDKIDLLLKGTGSYTLTWGSTWGFGGGGEPTSVDIDPTVIKVRYDKSNLMPIGLSDLCSTYWTTPNDKLGGELPSLWTQSRVGGSLVDSMGNNASLLLPYYSKAGGQTHFASYDDTTNALDIAASANDFVLAFWCKSETTTPPGVAYALAGKGNGDIEAGYYEVMVGATGKVSGTYKSSGEWGALPTSANSILDQLWHFIVVRITKSTHQIQLYVDNVRQGTDVTYTGTWQSMNGTIRFRLAKTSSGTGYDAPFSYSNVYIYHQTLSDADLTTLYNRGYVAGATAHWTSIQEQGNLITDVSGNNRALTINTADQLSVGYSTYGSRQCLDKGYTIYKYANPTLPDAYIPHDNDGVELVNPTVGSSYTRYADVVGNTTYHNLANSYIDIPNANWDRSNTTIWGNLARGAGYIASDPTAWYISELNQLTLITWANTNYKGLCFVKFQTDSVTDDRDVLQEIITYPTNKITTNLSKLLKYTGDYYYIPSNDDDYLSKTLVFEFVSDGSTPLTYKLTGLNGGQRVFVHQGDGTYLNLTKDSIETGIDAKVFAAGSYTMQICRADYLEGFEIGEYPNGMAATNISTFNKCVRLIKLILKNVYPCSGNWVGSIDGLNKNLVYLQLRQESSMTGDLSLFTKLSLCYVYGDFHGELGGIISLKNVFFDGGNQNTTIDITNLVNLETCESYAPNSYAYGSVNLCSKFQLICWSQPNTFTGDLINCPDFTYLDNACGSQTQEKSDLVGDITTLTKIWKFINNNTDSVYSGSLMGLIELMMYSCTGSTISKPTRLNQFTKLCYFIVNPEWVLSGAEVNQYLADVVANIATAGSLAKTLNFSGGTNGAPSGQGITDKNFLIAAGWEVLTN